MLPSPFKTESKQKYLTFQMNTILQRNDTEVNQAHFSLLPDWLIDSGASSHMTPHAEDLILNVEEFNAVVQVAKGVLISTT